MGSANDTELEVRFIRNDVVKASTDPKPHGHVLHLSNLDLLSGRFPVTYFYFYPKYPSPPITDHLKTSLSTTLDRYYPFAGRIVNDPTTNEPHIVCNNSGAFFAEAEANVKLSSLDFHNLDESLMKLVTVEPDFPLQVQLTRFTCGGSSMSFTFDHALGDAAAFGAFLVSWSEAARSVPFTRRPDHRRRILIAPRDPPRHRPELDSLFARCTVMEIATIPTPPVLLRRLYFVGAAHVDRLQSLAGPGRTKIEAFSAHVWKAVAKTVRHTCKMGWLVDGRDGLSLSDYVGNVLSLAFAEEAAGDLERGTLADVASEVHLAISGVANGGHFRDLVDWVESHRPGMMMSRVVLGRGGPALVLSAGRRFPVAEVDFGFGRPVLGTVCSTVERIGVAYMNQRPSAAGDGSWTVSAIVWPQLAAVLDEDPVFEPMTARHLNLV